MEYLVWIAAWFVISLVIFAFYAYFDKSGASKLVKYFAGFMLQPVALLDGYPMTAISRACYDWEQFKNLETEGKSRPLWLYTLEYLPSIPNPFVGEMAEPKFTSPIWRIRYGQEGINS